MEVATLTEYQAGAVRTLVVDGQRTPTDDALLARLGNALAAEAGEVSGAIDKYLRGDYGILEMRERLLKEGGDVLWCLATLLNHEKIPLVEAANENLRKLRRRMAQGKIRGDGDNR